MAKWGEGDPRWIVEERPDAINVNNWHWTEKDASAWSKEKLKNLLSSISVNNKESGSWKLMDITATGEASASNRKGKLIILYDWTINGKVEGRVTEEDELRKGTIEIANFSFENKIECTEITIKLEKSSDDLVRELRQEIIKKLQLYVELLTNDFSSGLVLPTVHSKPTPTTESVKVPANNKKVEAVSSSGVGLKISTKKAKVSDSFKCEANDLYNVLVTEEMVKAFTRSDAKVDGRNGGRFSMMGGQISGEYIQLERPVKIIKKWRSKEWPEGHFSTVTIELSQKDDCTELTLLQTGIPSTYHERTKEGWKRYIFEPIKNTFGYGARIL